MMLRGKRRFQKLLACACFVLIAASCYAWRNFSLVRTVLPLPRPHLQRPYGMAPMAFDAYIRACSAAQIDPDRITQTIGDYPLSRGYHLQDGTVYVKGVAYDYTTAVDLHIMGLNDAKIHRLLRCMARQGYACWFRDWPNDQHIHAVYSGLPMKPQLRTQIAEFRAEHRDVPWKPLALHVATRMVPKYYGS